MEPEKYLLGLMGFPLQHSLSPALHQAALLAAGLEGEYRLYPVPPLPGGEKALRELLGRIRVGDLHGLNVTIPHKQAVIPWLDGLSDEARAIGAVNTIFRKGDRLVGANTDAAGFLADLQRLGWLDELAGRQYNDPPLALVLGAGGAARAAVFALAQAGWQVAVSARRLEQAEALASELAKAVEGGKITLPKRVPPWPSGLAVPAITSLPLEPAGWLFDPPPELIVNATPLGMAPHTSARPWPAGIPFPQGGAVYDMVYLPQETVLVKAARAAGLKAASGLGMLVEQAGLAFEIWTGRGASRAAMRQAVAADLPDPETDPGENISR